MVSPPVPRLTKSLILPSLSPVLFTRLVACSLTIFVLIPWSISWLVPWLVPWLVRWSVVRLGWWLGVLLVVAAVSEEGLGVLAV